jgi:hypothetical protein
MNAGRTTTWVLGAAALLALTQAASAELMVRLQRFAQRDPLVIRPVATDGYPEGPSPYGYVRGDPVARRDPSGLDDTPLPPGHCHWEMGAIWPKLVCNTIESGWCQDTPLGGALHPTESCFRQVTPGCEPSIHRCCHIDAASGNTVCTEHTDDHGPATGGSGGTCSYGSACVCKHWTDIVGELWKQLCCAETR